MNVLKPDYYDHFHCLASACPDSCCQLWDVEIDPGTVSFYQSVPGPLGQQLRNSLYEEDGCTYLRLGEDGRCPLWRSDGLCRVQAELGAQAMSQVCTAYPRISHDFGDFEELGLELSCPEAARLILTENTGTWVTVQAPDEEAEYDHEALSVLLRTRQTARNLLNNPAFSPAQALALLLIYGVQAQEELDGEEPLPFDPEAALELGRQLAQPGGEAALLNFFRSLEIMTDAWRQLLEAPAAPAPWTDAMRSLAVYFVDRYWLQAVADYDLVSRVKLAAASCLVIHLAGGDLIRTAQLFSKEVENDADNIDRILDGCYDSPALTDAHLLGLLLG